jgi:hypothetical protein
MEVLLYRHTRRPCHSNADPFLRLTFEVSGRRSEAEGTKAKHWAVRLTELLALLILMFLQLSLWREARCPLP